jgi:hypothetical protein
MNEWLSQITLWHVGAIAVVCWAVVTIAQMVLKHLQKVRQAELEASLKEEMIRRGMSVAEITQILSATGTRAAGISRAPDPPTNPSR